MRKFIATIVASALFASCQAAKPSESPERKALVRRLESLEVEVKKEKLNMPMYRQSVLDLREVNREYSTQNIKAYADVSNIIIDQALVIGVFEDCDGYDVTLPPEMMGHCWGETTGAFRAVFKKYPDIKNDATIQKRYLNSDGFYSRDKIAAALLSKTSENIQELKLKLKE